MRTYSYHFYLYVSDPWLVLYQSLDQLIDFWSRTLLELFIGVLELRRARYPLVLHLVSSLKFEIVNFETESQIVRLFHVVPNMPHRTLRSGPFGELVGEIIECTWWFVVQMIRMPWHRSEQTNLLTKHARTPKTQQLWTYLHLLPIVTKLHG